MEPLAALAVSCNIIELVINAGKTCKLIKQVWDHKALPAHEELTSAISLLENNVEALDASVKSLQTQNHLTLQDDKELLVLARRCGRLGSELKQKLNALKVQANDTKADKIGKGLQTIFQEGKIYDLQRRWEELRKAVDTAVLVRTT